MALIKSVRGFTPKMGENCYLFVQDLRGGSYTQIFRFTNLIFSLKNILAITSK